MVKGFFLAVILCLFAAEVNARTACGPVTIWGATAGAYIHGNWTYVRGSSTFTPRSDGGVPFWDQGQESCGTCAWSMITDVDNPTFWTEGGGNDACRYSDLVYANVPPPPPLILEGNLKQITKHNAAGKRDMLNNLASSFDALTDIASGATIANPGWAVAALAFKAESKGAKWAAEDQDKIARDPCDPNNCDYTNQAYPVNPDDPCDVGCYMDDDQGMGVSGDYNYYVVNAKIEASGLIEAAVEESNRSGFCRAIANTDCENWHYWNALYYYSLGGQRLQDVGAGLNYVASTLQYYLGGDIQYWFGQLADAYYATGDDLKNAQ